MLNLLHYDWNTPLVSGGDKLLVQSARPLALNALDSSLTSEERDDLLRLQFRDVIIRDAIASGNMSISNGRCRLVTGRPLESFKGLVMEAALCRMCYDDPFGVGRRIFAWCTGRTIGRVPDVMISQHVPFITADKRLCRTPLTARFYDPSSAYDLHFYKINAQGNAELAHETGPRSGIVAGVQVKAIQGNERTEIIDKLLSGRYTRVLTMLRHKNGEHSFEACRRLLTDMQRNREIDGDQLADVLDRLTHPDAVGISQSEVDSYSKSLDLAYAGFEPWEDDPNVVESIGLEVVARLKREPSGILMPDQPDLIIPNTVH
ncbi:hypothetical protein ACF8E6_02630 [Pseudomonas sp. xss_1]|uniref:hypothetical protein n=1 Tax=Pseudomonas sp. xss_1 TaxID=3367214 RepID=UPI00370CDEEF